MLSKDILVASQYTKIYSVLQKTPILFLSKNLPSPVKIL